MGEARRDAFSHVNADGLAKRSFEDEAGVTLEVARLEAETGQRFDWYVCSQGPEHWHITRQRPRPPSAAQLVSDYVYRRTGHRIARDQAERVAGQLTRAGLAAGAEFEAALSEVAAVLASDPTEIRAQLAAFARSVP